MAEEVTLEKGSRVRVRMMGARPMGSYSLAGWQTKLAVQQVEFEGEVTHMRGDGTGNVKSARIWVRKDSGEEVVVGLKSIVAIMGHGVTYE